MTTIPVIGTGADDDPRRPDLPDDAAYSVIADHGDTMDVLVEESVDARLADVEAAIAGDAAAVQRIKDRNPPRP